MDTDNRLREFAAWLLHDQPDAEPSASLEWLVDQPADSYFRAVMFRAVNLPCYERDQWFLLGWREKTPTWPRLIEPLGQVGLKAGTVERLIAGGVIRLEAKRADDLWTLTST